MNDKTNNIEKRDNRSKGKQKRRNYYHKKQSSRRNPKEFKQIKVEETADDIRQDIKRIEKEIELEIKEIATLKLGI